MNEQAIKDVLVQVLGNLVREAQKIASGYSQRDMGPPVHDVPHDIRASCPSCEQRINGYSDCQ